MAHVVSVEHHRVMAHGVKPLLEDISDGRFAGAGKAGKPDDRRALMLQHRALRLAHQEWLPMKVGSAPETEVDHPCTNRVVREPVDNDETAGSAILRVRVESHRRGCRKIANPDVVEPKRMRRKVL